MPLYNAKTAYLGYFASKTCIDSQWDQALRTALCACACRGTSEVRHCIRVGSKPTRLPRWKILTLLHSRQQSSKERLRPEE